MSFLSLFVIGVLIAAAAVANAWVLKQLVDRRIVPPLEDTTRKLGQRIERLEGRTERLETITGDVPRAMGQHIERLDGRLKRLETQSERLETQSGGRLERIESAILSMGLTRFDPEWDEEGKLARLKVADDETMGAKNTPRFAGSVTVEKSDPITRRLFARRAYELVEARNGAVFTALKVPYFQYHNAGKKLDIVDTWNEPFGAIANAAIDSGNTYLLHDRLHTLWQAVRSVSTSRAPICEIGVWRGGSSRFLAEAQRHFGKSGRIYACDTFAGHARVDSKFDAEHQTGGFGDDVDFEAVKQYLAPYPEIQVVRGDIEKTAAQITDAAIAMIHLDVDVYHPTKFVLETLGKRVEPNGIVLVDDYGFTTCPGAKRAVDEFLAADGDFRIFHLLTGQALLVRSAPTSRA